MEKYDLIVIGSGPAGEKGAAQAAYFGKRVALIECSSILGGACVNTGTIPSKILRESALYYSGVQQRGLYGVDYSLKDRLTVKNFMHRKDVVVETQREKLRENLAAHKVDLIRGFASFEGPNTVAVHTPRNEKLALRGEVILIGTGSAPHRAPEIPFDDEVVFDSDSILQMVAIPKSLAVIGGGVIGCEYASIFTALGVEVALVDGRDRVLPFLDAEISECLRQSLADLGVRFYFGERMSQIERIQNSVRITLHSEKTIEMEAALFAAGRRGVVEKLRLESAGVRLNKRGYIEVNENYRTSAPSIYAAGDVIGFPALASTSMEQARVAVCHAFGFQYKQRLASNLPMGIYTIPEISAVGETEESCKEKKIDYEVGRARYPNNVRGQIVGDRTGLMKLIFKKADRRLLGVQIIGENATELIHLGMMALESGMALDVFIEFAFNYPTLSEMYKYAAYDGLGNLTGHKLREG
ncbi:MAG TPA: Si-specific NAD(P)(+) transhydrogenase [Candidatus Dormibacteraeota bacterium]|nr:Si-specific NAD(P)(+) transhydrogenase [Candidatus Dormibacteraeota bacterium]